ncbi:MAG: choice-of-anchor B family protein [Rhodothermales bacterium]
MKLTVGFLASLLLASLSPSYAQTSRSDGPVNVGMAGFGASFLIDGERLLVTRSGLSTMFPEPPNQTGALITYTRQDGDWKEQGSITPDDVTVSDAFGTSMALSGDWLAVSAPMANEGCGAIYLFKRAGAGWNESARVTPADCDGEVEVGQALAFDGATLIASAHKANDGQGALYVFRADRSGTWSQVDRMDNAAGDHIGYGVSLRVGTSGLFVGAPGLNGTGGILYHPRDGQGWGAAETIAPSDTTLRIFGADFSVAGDELFVAAPGVSFTAGGPPAEGAVVSFKRQGGAWTESGTLRLDSTYVEKLDIGVPSSFGFGSAVQVRGNALWVGSLLSGGAAGSIFVYHRAGADGAWTVAQQIRDAKLAAFASFGQQFALSDDFGITSAPMSDFGNGRMYVLARNRSTDTWSIGQTIGDTGRQLKAITGNQMQCKDGKVADFACADVELASFMPVGDIGGAEGDIVNDLWGWTDSETGREYVVIGHSFSTSFVDISDPANPRYLGTLPAPEGSKPNAWRDAKVYANHAFIVADGVGQHGMQIFDLTQLRDVTEPQTFTETAHYDGVASAHNVVINEETGFAFIVGANGGGTSCGGGLHMVDIRDPLKPTFAGCFNDQSSSVSGRGYSHDAQCVVYKGPDEAYVGREICFGSNESALSIADVTEKSAPVPISTVSYPNVSYAHQGWLTEDHRYFYMNDEGDELEGLTDGTRTLIWDVAELDDPVLAGVYIGETKASDHNLYVRGNLLYESNYVSGLRIMDITDPVAPKEVGYIDTVPWGKNDPGYAGSWSNYPYFKSGIIPVSSIKEGLFLVRYTQEIMP